MAPANADGEAATGGQVEWAPPPVNFVHNEQIQWSAVKPPILEAIESGVQRGLNAGVCVCDIYICLYTYIYIYIYIYTAFPGTVYISTRTNTSSVVLYISFDSEYFVFNTLLQ